MAALPLPALATVPAPSRRSPVMLVVDLVACITGCTLLFVGAVQPDLQSRPVSVLTAAPFAVRRDAERAAGNPRLVSPSADPASSARRADATTTHDPLEAGPI